jgi:hypothetical protein
MKQMLIFKTLTDDFGKPQIKLGLFVFIILLIFNTNSFAKHEGLEERLYSKMTDFNVQRATENLMLTLETKPDGEKHVWKSGSYKGYIIPKTTFINFEGYFCRTYIEVLIRRSEYNMYDNTACRDHDGEWVWIETTSANETQGNVKINH